ncbi:hypothetical protein BIY27_13380 [Gibbsiella quercinecans]|nr:hypothetical protein BIY27_13380 [Gibbsiella quercinecans]
MNSFIFFIYAANFDRVRGKSKISHRAVLVQQNRAVAGPAIGAFAPGLPGVIRRTAEGKFL